MDLHRAALSSSAQSPPHPPNPSCGSCCPYPPPQAFTDTADSYLAPFLPRYRTAVYPSISDAVFIKPHGSFLFFSCACFPATDINFKRIPFVPQRTPSRTGGNTRRLLLSHLRPDVHARSAPTPPRPSLRLRQHPRLRLHPHLDLHGAYGSLAASCRHGPEASEQGPRPPAHQRNPQRPAGGGRSDCHSLLGPRQAAVLLINPLKVKNMVG